MTGVIRDMTSDFSRTLALLRREKKISQRTAAGDLGVSQALLSHYENGLREPGLAFVVRAADYYGVSCDYLLGRSMARDGSAVPDERKAGSADAQTRKSRVSDALSLLLDMAAQTGSTQLPGEIEGYISVLIYKAYRYLYLADPTGVEAVFRAGREQFDYLCDARLKRHELRIRAAAGGQGGFGMEKETLHRLPIAPNDLAARYPTLAPAFLTVLQQVSDAIEEIFPEMQKRK